MTAQPHSAPRDFTRTRHSTSYDLISPLKLDLSCRYAVFTGAAWDTGVGFATAKAFARAGVAGIAVVDQHGVSDNLVADLKQVAKEAGRDQPVVISCTTDIADAASVRAAYDKVVAAFSGRLDVLVNNAAHMEPYERFLDADPDVYWRTWQVNLGGLFNMARAFLPMMLSARESGDGLCTMVNVSSSGALSARPASTGYRSSKLAITRWTESIQLDYADQGLLAFSINPGAIKTEITKGGLPEYLRNTLPDKPEIAGDTIVWLVAGRHAWLAGRYISCPWDMEELIQMKSAIIEEDKLKLKMAF
ncbi:3-oxoacyl-[acyl-carrier-protein] reductase [Verticillium alfalfae VaMs.102]|uniref:3-oxoacyl-[acyl-carrier-protein] reductase n=1 Tax=Verticillium alfalfae (strain VaMs.102 / ATCC MYA-4576 / FGSC 10136) TaxID=526221 RepID=C9S5V6_VERA1|nr:3-oxoacyl-[acyl-carrier-protein] reductase [Verticillium alfalfae VaMs.102]EEY15095.1 3-oxoacyl-[acyl-carrier-protein] reductase [Verticillium alfalfae VaMs.102]